MDNNTLEMLGITKEELESRIVNRAVSELLTGIGYDEDGDEYPTRSSMAKKLNDLMVKRVDEKVVELADKHVLPKLDKFIETLTLQQTNKWGEKKGKKVTFIEYLVSRAEHYMVEEVNSNGKTKSEGDSYSWRKAGTRISYAVDHHMQYSIENAMKKAIDGGNAILTDGIMAAVKIKLDEVSEKLKVTVKTK